MSVFSNFFIFALMMACHLQTITAICGLYAFECSSSTSPQQPLVPGCHAVDGSSCCCSWGLVPAATGCGCTSPSASSSAPSIAPVTSTKSSKPSSTPVKPPTVTTKTISPTTFPTAVKSKTTAPTLRKTVAPLSVTSVAPSSSTIQSCGAGAFQCAASSPTQPFVPGCNPSPGMHCCCNWGLTPSATGCGCDSGPAPPTSAPVTSAPSVSQAPSARPITSAPTFKVTKAPSKQPVTSSPINQKNDIYNSIWKVNNRTNIFVPPQFCAPENCPNTLGQCTSSTTCSYEGNYKSISTYPTAMATYYCDLKGGGCNGVLGPTIPANDTAVAMAKQINLPLCYSQLKTGEPCVGIAAVPPIMMGNNQLTWSSNPDRTVPAWGSGLSVATGWCYKLTGPSGVAYVAITDRCGGYCNCPSTNTGIGECGGQCVSSSWPPIQDLTPNCQCRGSTNGISTCSTQQDCDWCAANDHPHFDLDQNTFNNICGDAGRNAGSCAILGAEPIPNCVPTYSAWPVGK